MALRIIDIYVPAEHDNLQGLDEEYDIVDHWTTQVGDRCHVRVLIDTDKTETFLEDLQERLKMIEDSRVLISAVEATWPRRVRPEPEELPPAQAAKEELAVSRISREELWQDLEQEISGTTIYHALVALSTVVAAGGMMRDSVAIVIGAMVIAPLIGPNIASSFATTVGDTTLLRRAVKVNVLGLLFALVLSILVGVIFFVDPTTPEIANRMVVHWADIVLALAAGSAGVLSFTRGISTALIGVMVAVALLPPLVAVGLLLGSGYWHGAYGASLLVLTNVVCINLAAVITFLLQGIRPVDWYEAKKARRHTRAAIALWGVLLFLLVLAAFLIQQPTIE